MDRTISDDHNSRQVSSRNWATCDGVTIMVGTLKRAPMPSLPLPGKAASTITVPAPPARPALVDITDQTVRATPVACIRGGLPPKALRRVREYIDALERNDISPKSIEAERDAAVLLELFFGTNEAPDARVLNGPQIEQLAEVTGSFLGLPKDARDNQIDAIATRLAGVIEQLRPSLQLPALTQSAERTFENYVNGQLAPIQLETLRRALERLQL